MRQKSPIKQGLIKWSWIGQRGHWARSFSTAYGHKPKSSGQKSGWNTGKRNEPRPLLWELGRDQEENELEWLLNNIKTKKRFLEPKRPKKASWRPKGMGQWRGDGWRYEEENRIKPRRKVEHLGLKTQVEGTASMRTPGRRQKENKKRSR